MNIYYLNHLNEKIDLDSENIILQYQELFDYSWDAATSNNAIVSFYRDSATIPVTVAITADTDEEYSTILDDFHSTVSKDIIQLIPGKLYIGNQYLICYISGDIKKDAFMGVPIQVKNLTIVTDHPFWIREHPHSFKASEVTSTNNKRYPGRYAHRYANGLNNTTIVNVHYAESNFIMRIYGPCVKPSVYIGGYEYHSEITLEAGEYLEIDSMEETVTKIMLSGIRVNSFHYRSFKNSIFRPVPPGEQDISWDGSFEFDLILMEERSEPRWS